MNGNKCKVMVLEVDERLVSVVCVNERQLEHISGCKCVGFVLEELDTD